MCQNGRTFQFQKISRSDTSNSRMGRGDPFTHLSSTPAAVRCPEFWDVYALIHSVPAVPIAAVRKVQRHTGVPHYF